MNSIDVLAKIYKPYKVIIKNNCKIFNCLSGNYVIKQKKDKDINELYKYLKSRNFNYYPNLIEYNRDEVNVFEYKEDISIDSEQKLLDLINIVSLLHNKTSFYKEVTNDKFKSIYDELLGRVSYIEEYISNVVNEIEDETFMSPSGYLLVINSSKIYESLTFLKHEIEEWYKITIDTNKMRVCIVHNNLELDHFIKNEDDYLISWDNYIIDTPILDIVNLYKKVYLNIDFSEVLKQYMEKFPLNDGEKKLLFIMLVIPSEINLSNNELLNVSIVRKYLDYIYKTENLIRPYYSV